VSAGEREASAAVIRRRAVVRGRVQGVSFRAHTQMQARRLGVVGWVRNARDGSVELEAQGPAAAVAELLAWCQRGPAAAEVRSVDVEECAPVAGEHELSVQRDRR
jgi:acylphosphatase